MRPVEFLEEDNGSLSATRLALLVWAIGVLAAWIYISITKETLQAIPSGVSAIIGVLMTGKVVQKFGEKPAEDDAKPLDSKLIGADKKQAGGQSLIQPPP